MISSLSVDIAKADEQPVLENLLQLYIHDFSEFYAGTPRCDLEADGRFRADVPIGDWWRLEGHFPYLVRSNGRLAGFVLLNTRTHSGAAADRNVAEFFVVRKYRRSGVGRAVAHDLFTRCPGRWEAAVMRANTGARRFWEHAITSHPGLAHIDVADDGDFDWNGTIFRFDIAPA